MAAASTATRPATASTTVVPPEPEARPRVEGVAAAPVACVGVRRARAAAFRAAHRLLQAAYPTPIRPLVP